jgi:hypothetical protein
MSDFNQEEGTHILSKYILGSFPRKILRKFTSTKLGINFGGKLTEE